MMEYRERFLDADYAVFNGHKTRIEHIFYGNRNTFIPILKTVAYDILRRKEQCYIVYHVGEDLKIFVMGCISPNQNNEFLVRIMQMSMGPQGIDIGEKIPKMDHTHLIPLITLQDDPTSKNGTILNSHTDKFERDEDGTWIMKEFREYVVKQMINRLDDAA